MKKIPLETTLVGGYRFLFTNIISIIGTVWFPYLLLCAVFAGAIYLVVPHEVLQGDFSHINRALILAPKVHAARALIGIASFIVAAMIIVNLMRHALGLNKHTTFIYFSLGKPVWRLIGAIILGVVVLAVLALVLVLVCVAAVHFASTLPHGIAVATKALIIIFAICFFIYAYARLFFFLPAVVVAESRIGLGRSWSLGGGNFWRIVFVYVLCVIPVWFIAGIVLDLTILPVLFAELIKLPKHPHPNDLMPLIRAMAYALPVVIPTVALASLAARSLLIGAIGTAYNAVATPALEGNTEA